MPSHTHDVMCLVDIMVEDYHAGRMISYNTLRNDLVQWVDAEEGLLLATRNALPVVEQLTDERRSRSSLRQLKLSLGEEEV